MGKRTPNPRLVKRHRSYTVDEAARCLKIHKNTVGRWIKSDGLEAIVDRRPFLIRGIALQTFLIRKREQRRSECPPGHLYCLKCREPKIPDGGFAEYRPIGPSHGNLRGLCPTCGSIMNRAIRECDLPTFEPFIEILLPEGESSLSDRSTPPVTGDFEEED